MTSITERDAIDLGKGQITKLKWSPDGRFLALPTESGWVAIFDIQTRKVIRTIGRHSGAVTTVAWDRKAEYMMTGSVDRSIGLWEVATGDKAEFPFQGHKGAVHTIEWTDEDAYAITCSANRLRALDGACLLAGWSEEMEAGVNRQTD